MGKTVWGNVPRLAAALSQNENLRKRLLIGAAMFAVLQVYFVRELLAAELLFGLLFTSLIVLAGIFYVIGTVGQWGIDRVQSGFRVAAGVARRNYGAAEDLTRKLVRHPHSESAP